MSIIKFLQKRKIQMETEIVLKYCKEFQEQNPKNRKFSSFKKLIVAKNLSSL